MPLGPSNEALHWYVTMLFRPFLRLPRILEEWDHRHLSTQHRWHLPSFLPRWAAVAAAIVLAIGLGGFSTVATAEAAVPGELLYPVKEFKEGAQLWFTRSPEGKVAKYSTLVKERAKELRDLATKGKTGPNLIALSRLEGHIEDVNRLVESNSEAEDISRDPEFQEKIEEFIIQQDLAELAVQGVLNSASEDIRPELQQSLELIQRSRQRVEAALEAIRQK